MRLDRSDPDLPTAWVEFRNFGNMPAEESVIDVASEIKGNVVADPLGKRQVVCRSACFSPDAPYFFGAMVPSQYLKPVLSGSAKLVVMIEAKYNDIDLRPHCYQTRNAYMSFPDKFDPDGGSSSSCNDAMPTYSSRTTIDRSWARNTRRTDPPLSDVIAEH